ncbi:hypothetical protein [Streptomyces armeniacus]|uniref:hypothetical protein n=1 Tax=Streptomyces armeniacus TaxID=83291 RepID=UPI00319EBC25
MREGQHLLGVAGAHPGLHDQYGVLPAHEADVRYERHAPVRYDHHVAGDLPYVRDVHGGFGHGLVGLAARFLRHRRSSLGLPVRSPVQPPGLRASNTRSAAAIPGGYRRCRWICAGWATSSRSPRNSTSAGPPRGCTVGLAPTGHTLLDGLVTVPLDGMPPSRLVVAWSGARATPLVRSFARIAVAQYGYGRGPGA